MRASRAYELAVLAGCVSAAVLALDERMLFAITIAVLVVAIAVVSLTAVLEELAGERT